MHRCCKEKSNERETVNHVEMVLKVRLHLDLVIDGCHTLLRLVHSSVEAVTEYVLLSPLVRMVSFCQLVLLLFIIHHEAGLCRVLTLVIESRLCAKPGSGEGSVFSTECGGIRSLLFSDGQYEK